MRLTRRLALLLLVPGVAHAEPNNPPVWPVEALMARLRAVPSARATFDEVKEIAALNVPLHTSGRLIYVAPDRLEKQTLAPRPALMAVDGDHLRVELPDQQPRLLNLGDYPELGGLVAGIRATLAGDLATLLRFYNVRLDGTPDGWSLTLDPLAARMRALVRQVRLIGAGAAITRVETYEASGDRSVMTISADPA